MPSSPTNTLSKLNRALDAWEQHAEEAVFGGMTLAQFKTRVKPSLDYRDQAAIAQGQLQTALDNRDNADVESVTALQAIVSGVKADPDHGDDSALYASLGYIRRSERKSGLKRTKTIAKAA
ncbi:MAG: hypothetical protein HY043_16305 [Verrucomicrobia bacterium]|nr:hypothetical protein [Verrucomicrobiota bacterium]